MQQEMVADGVEFRLKPDWDWRHWYLAVVAAIAGKAFVERFATTRQNTVYLRRDGYASDALLEHEWRHVKQWREEGAWYDVKYLLFPSCQLEYELEAFTDQMRKHRQLHGVLPSDYVERIIEIATHPYYCYGRAFWKDLKGQMRSRLQKTAVEIQNE